MTAIVLCKDIFSTTMRTSLTTLLVIEHFSSEKAVYSKRRMNYPYYARSMSPSLYLAIIRNYMSFHQEI